jgi:hypothetical protein
VEQRYKTVRNDWANNVEKSSIKCHKYKGVTQPGLNSITKAKYKNNTMQGRRQTIRNSGLPVKKSPVTNTLRDDFIDILLL